MVRLEIIEIDPLQWQPWPQILVSNLRRITAAKVIETRAQYKRPIEWLWQTNQFERKFALARH